MKWRKVVIDVGAGPREAVAPEVLPASRATDVPACHGGRGLGTRGNHRAARYFFRSSWGTMPPPVAHTMWVAFSRRSSPNRAAYASSSWIRA